MLQPYYVLPFKLKSDESQFSERISCSIPLSELCRYAIFNLPSVFIDVTVRGIELFILLRDEIFRKRYETVLGYPGFPRFGHYEEIDFFVSQEVPFILREPTTRFARLIDKWRARHDAYDDWCAIGWNLRTCADCGWHMQNQTISENIECATHLLGGVQNSSRRNFATCDSRGGVETLKAMLPQDYVEGLLDNVPETLLHTEQMLRHSHKGFETSALPYLDHFLLGECKTYVGCLSTYGQTAVARTGYKNGVIRWVHDPAECRDPKLQFHCDFANVKGSTCGWVRERH
jgi:hypothetical protein